MVRSAISCCLHMYTTSSKQRALQNSDISKVDRAILVLCLKDQYMHAELGRYMIKGLGCLDLSLISHLEHLYPQEKEGGREKTLTGKTFF